MNYCIFFKPLLYTQAPKKVGKYETTTNQRTQTNSLFTHKYRPIHMQYPSFTLPSTTILIVCGIAVDITVELIDFYFKF